MAWRLADSLEMLRAQIDARWPARSKVSDGSIGDAAHATRDSDHNPHCGHPADPTVTAIDITHDPDGGPDCSELAEALRLSKDPRIKYVIWNNRMFSCYATSSHEKFVWRPYSGPNPHTKHMHVSVNCSANKDSTFDWAIARKEFDEMATKAEIKEVVREVVREVLEEELRDMRVKLAVGTEQQGYDADKINLKAILHNLSGN
jgi:hypothetical protein